MAGAERCGSHGLSVVGCKLCPALTACEAMTCQLM